METKNTGNTSRKDFIINSTFIIGGIVTAPLTNHGKKEVTTNPDHYYGADVQYPNESFVILNDPFNSANLTNVLVFNDKNDNRFGIVEDYSFQKLNYVVRDTFSLGNKAKIDDIKIFFTHSKDINKSKTGMDPNSPFYYTSNSNFNSFNFVFNIDKIVAMTNQSEVQASLTAMLAAATFLRKNYKEGITVHDKNKLIYSSKVFYSNVYNKTLKCINYVNNLKLSNVSLGKISDQKFYELMLFFSEFNPIYTDQAVG